MRQNMINTLSVERLMTQQPLNNPQCNCNQCISSAMFMGLESKSSWQVNIHPSTYIMKEDPIDEDEEDQHALTHAYVQVEELHNNIKKKKQARFDGIEIPFPCTENKSATPNQSSSSTPLHVTKVPPTTASSFMPKVASANTGPMPANKAPGMSPPQYKYQSPMDNPIVTQKLLERLLDIQVSVST
ncbi:hypothetical protein ID866_10399 [Astraeus odoratus]|nr:hypothetical protein ID866_10399 [Astraeus odoratus]